MGYGEYGCSFKGYFLCISLPLNLKDPHTNSFTVYSSPPSAAYMCQWIRSALVQACHLFGAKPFPEPMLACCQLDSWEQISVKFESEFCHFELRPSSSKNTYFSLSVCLSVCQSVTPFWQCSCHRIIMKFWEVITIDRHGVHAKGQGQRSKLKVTEVMTPFSHFQTVTPLLN